MRVAILFAVLGGTAAWAQSDLGCNKDTDCKGDRICVSGQCVSPPSAAPAQPAPQQNYAPPPQQNYPPPQQNYAPPPPQQGYYAPNYPPPNYPPPPPAYYPRREREYYSPIIWGLSGTINAGFLVDQTSGTGYGGITFDGYGELGGRITPGFGLVGLLETNGGSFDGGNIGTWTGTIGGGVHFGQRVGLTLGIGATALAANNVGEGGFSMIGHLSIPFGWYGFGLHLQAMGSFYQDFDMFTVGIGLGWSH